MVGGFLSKIRGKKEEKTEETRPESKIKWFMTIDGITYLGNCPLENEKRRRYAASGKGGSVLDVMDEIKKEWNFPKNVDYVSRTDGNYLLIGASYIEEAKEILMNNKNVIEKRCNVKISDKVKLKEH